MLQKVPVLDSAVIRALIVALLGVIGIVCSFFGVNEALFSSEKVARLADGFATLLTLGGVIWAAIARTTQPTPPLTNLAVDKTQTAISEGKLQTVSGDSVKSAQGGYVRSALLAAMVAIGSVAMIGVTACVNTRAALQAADTPSDYALVFLEGYDGALKSANALKESGTLAGQNLECVRAAELKAWEVVKKIDPLRVAYERTKSAADEQALQLSVDNAIQEAADFVRIVRGLRGGQSFDACSNLSGG